MSVRIFDYRYCPYECSVPQWQRIVWSGHRCRVVGCQDRQTSPGRGRSLSLPTPGENTDQKAKKASKRAAPHLGGSWKHLAVYVYPKRTLQSDFPNPTNPLALPPSLPLPLPYRRWDKSVSWTGGSSVYADVGRGKNGPRSRPVSLKISSWAVNMH